MQLGIAAVTYGLVRSSPKNKTYSSRYSVQPSSTTSAVDLACACTVAAVAWGSEGALSEQLQHLVLFEHASQALSPPDRSKTILITSRMVVPNVKPTMRISVTVFYLLESSEGSLEVKRLHTALFGKDHVVIHGITFDVFCSPTEALSQRPNAKSSVLCNMLTISGLNLSPPVNVVVETLVRMRAPRLRTLVWF